MYKKFDVLFSEVRRSHYIVIRTDFNLRTYNLQEFDPIKWLFGSVTTYSHQELEDNHFHINGESKIRRRIKEIIKTLDIEDFTHEWPWDDWISIPYYDEEKTEKILLEACWLKHYKKGFDSNPVIKENHSWTIYWTIEPWFDWNWNLIEISIVPIPELESKSIRGWHKPSVVLIDDPEPKPVKTVQDRIEYWIGLARRLQ